MIRLFLKCVTWISLIQVGHLLRERSLTIAIEDFNLATESLATFNKPQIHTTQVSRKWSSTVLKTRYTNTGIPWNGPNIKRKLYIGDIILIICFRKWQNFMWDWFIGTLNRNIIGQFFRLQNFKLYTLIDSSGTPAPVLHERNQSIAIEDLSPLSHCLSFDHCVELTSGDHRYNIHLHIYHPYNIYIYIIAF